MKNNTICLLITTYNRTFYLKRAIESVYYIPFDEIIVVDDGSNQETIHDIEIFLKNCPKVKYIKHMINKGVGIAKNTGISESKSDWICCLDDDDYFSRDVIDDVKKFMQIIPVADVIHYKIETLKYNHRELWGAEMVTLEGIKEENIIPNGSFFKKKIWKDLGGFRNIPFEDWDLWIRAKQHNYNFVFYPNIFYTREIRLDDSSMLFRDKKRISYDEWKKLYIKNE